MIPRARAAWDLGFIGGRASACDIDGPEKINNIFVPGFSSEQGLERTNEMLMDSGVHEDPQTKNTIVGMNPLERVLRKIHVFKDRETAKKNIEIEKEKEAKRLAKEEEKQQRQQIKWESKKEKRQKRARAIFDEYDKEREAAGSYVWVRDAALAALYKAKYGITETFFMTELSAEEKRALLKDVFSSGSDFSSARRIFYFFKKYGMTTEEFLDEKKFSQAVKRVEAKVYHAFIEKAERQGVRDEFREESSLPRVRPKTEKRTTQSSYADLKPKGRACDDDGRFDFIKACSHLGVHDFKGLYDN